MRIVNDLELASWRPDFSSSGQSIRPQWTRVLSGGIELANTVEWLEWYNPVQVVVCEACGFTHCSSGSYVHVSHIGNVVVWSPPQLDWVPDEEDTLRYAASFAVRQFGGVAFPPEEWEKLRAITSDVPVPADLPTATLRVIADCWRMGARGSSRAPDLQSVIPMLESRLLGTDSFSSHEAIEILRPLVEWLKADSDKAAAGQFVSTGSLGVEVQTLYFDGPPESDWPAFALSNERPLLAMSREWVFQPGAG